MDTNAPVYEGTSFSASFFLGGAPTVVLPPSLGIPASTEEEIVGVDDNRAWGVVRDKGRDKVVQYRRSGKRNQHQTKPGNPLDS
mmetsp:Transcript_36787/g.57801  ORF Transcript_36787/g.57801 Transcript_36787/m.57801 type:complete len:84 (-) Transcript_36787:113-364(-)